MTSKWITVVVCLAILSTSPARNVLPAEEDVLHFVEEYDRSWNHKDASAVARLLATNYVYFSSTGQVQSREHVLEMVVSPKYILTSAERSEVKVYRMSDTAVVSSRWKGQGSYEGKEFRDDQRCSIVLVRDGQTWRVLSEHCTQIAVP